jgi:hypothetical protein
VGHNGYAPAYGSGRLGRRIFETLLFALPPASFALGAGAVVFAVALFVIVVLGHDHIFIFEGCGEFGQNAFDGSVVVIPFFGIGLGTLGGCPISTATIVFAAATLFTRKLIATVVTVGLLFRCATSPAASRTSPTTART